MNDLTFFFKGIIFTTPFLLIQFIGLVLSLVLRSRLPKAWGAAAFAFVLLIAGNLSWLVYYALFVWVFSKSRDYDTLDKVAIGQGIFQAITGLLGYALLLFALFRRRDPQ